MTQMIEAGRIHWEKRGSCNTNSHLWFSTRRVDQLQAKHICLYHCPVLIDCMQANLDRKNCGVVVAGKIWKDKYPPGQLSSYDAVPPEKAPCCLECDPL